MTFLANIGSDWTGSFAGGQGISLWQTAGGLLAVFGLLVVSLKFLGKWQRRSGHGQAALLAVWNLGPRREIQVLRLEDEAHYIYRHDGAMVLLKKSSYETWEASQAGSEGQKSDPRALAGKFFPAAWFRVRGPAIDLTD